MPGSQGDRARSDGSGMYTLQSLWTMARERLDVVTVILANPPLPDSGYRDAKDRRR